MTYTNDTFEAAFESTNVAEFLGLLFPDTWGGIRARIVESGALEFQEGARWAPQWGQIPLTVKKGETSAESKVKACIYRVHDCLHQLWGLPIPSTDFSQDDYMHYKRVQICGEVAVLMLTEFQFCKHLYDNSSPHIQRVLLKRNAVNLMLPGAPLANKTPAEIALRLDELLHKQIRPAWVRDNPHAVALCDDYVPMVQYDRDVIDANWRRMKREKWQPIDVPNTKFRDDLSGLELTLWMINDFFHLMSTSGDIDLGLAKFNQQRRSLVVFPDGWNELPEELQ